jgi:16S rRNA (guanine527-N7)-methyltransferase
MPHGRIADLGSGAGLPGIPVALALPESQVTLVERMGKRVGFLENQKVLLGLDSITIMEREVERVSGLFDIITFRAFRPFSEAKLFKTIGKLLSPGGSIIAYKGRHETAAAELSASAFGANPGRIIPVDVPFLDEERCLVVIQQSGS